MKIVLPLFGILFLFVVSIMYDLASHFYMPLFSFFLAVIISKGFGFWSTQSNWVFLSLFLGFAVTYVLSMFQDGAFAWFHYPAMGFAMICGFLIGGKDMKKRSK